jgi:hypothetical protein
MKRERKRRRFVILSRRTGRVKEVKETGNSKEISAVICLCTITYLETILRGKN